MVDNITIKNFGEQWLKFQDTSGFFGSLQLFEDFISPFAIDDFANKKVADIGAGTGRFSLSLLEAGAKEVIVLEPSDAIQVAKEKLCKYAQKVRFLNITGEKLSADECLDVAISIGVIHHIPQPIPVIQAVYKALKPGGKFIIWLYGKENNRLYLVFLLPLRLFVKRLPSWGKSFVANTLNFLLSGYVKFCKIIPYKVPLKDYILSIIEPLPKDKRKLVIYDQLNPRYAKYYTRQEAIRLMSCVPFNVEIYHRKKYSWVVIGTK